MRTAQRSVPSFSAQPGLSVACATARASQRRSQLGRRIAMASLLAGFGLGIASAAQAKPFEEYIKPMPPVAALSSATWGVTGDPGVIPRDISNGIESAKGAGVHPQWYYWDGQIIKAKDGKYHMFMSTFDANTNFGTGWFGSDVYHAISQTNVLGPYERQDYVYPSSKGGHNVSAVELPTGGYAVIASETIPFTVYQSTSLDGPWTKCNPQSPVKSNISLWPRHDGKFEITERGGGLYIADTLCGNYVKQTPKTNYTTRGNGSIYPAHTSIPGVSNPSWAYEEDPHIWRSGGTYHIIYSGSGDRVGWHVYSPDGLTDWKDNGYAWSPRDYKKIFCYEGSTHCDAWYKMERPGVVLQDGHPTHITWAVADVDKDNQVLPGTNHGTKVIVVPFDGVAFDNDFGTGGGTGGAGGSTGAGGATGTGGATGAGGRTGGLDGGAGNGGNAGSGGAGGSASGGTSGGKDGGPGGSGGASSSGGNTTTTTSSGGSSGVGAGGSSASSGGHGGSVSAAGGSSASGGTTSGSGGSSSTNTAGGKGGSTTTTTTVDGNGGSSGCSCTLGSTSRGGMIMPSLLLGALGMLLARRRNTRNRDSR